MHITVTASPGSHEGHLEAGSLHFPCALGRSGIVMEKREGDGGTPRGVWPLRDVYFRADRLETPTTGLTLAPIHPGLGWCDASTDPAYNTLVALPWRASAEQMWREDSLYDIVIVLGYNDRPVKPGAGSAIFFHLAKETPEGLDPTRGCVALRRHDMLKILPVLKPGCMMRIMPAGLR